MSGPALPDGVDRARILEAADALDAEIEAYRELRHLDEGADADHAHRVWLLIQAVRAWAPGRMEFADYDDLERLERAARERNSPNLQAAVAAVRSSPTRRFGLLVDALLATDAGHRALVDVLRDSLARSPAPPLVVPREGGS